MPWSCSPAGREHDGVASFGMRPTFDSGAPLLEIHVLDFSGDLYGEEVVVTFLAWLRPEEKFASADALIAAMGRMSQAPGQFWRQRPRSCLDRRLAALA